MGGLIQPSPVAEERAQWRPILIGVVIVVVVVGIVVLGLRESPKGPKGPPPYAPNLTFSNVEKSAAENFVGATVAYVDGNITNKGTKTVIRATAHVIFRDTMGQIVGDESVPLRVLQKGGPYLDTTDLNTSPLGPGQTKPFRLTFEHISSQWNQQVPDLEITDVVTK
jgi:hypothetical protein